MKKYFQILVFIITVTLINSCSESINESQNKIAPVQEIQIFYKYSFKNELDTYKLKYTKDLVLDGTITTDFWLTKEEQEKIIQKVEEINFFNLPDSLTWTESDSTKLEFDPDPGKQILKINYENKEKNIYWYLVNSYPEEHNKIIELTNTIEEIIYKKPEYKSLPAANGLYN
ncbi:MAG: hypothetical protein IPH62_19165 [Ignavibacteriae bacterium]|nr:hypothetical protein [Ignavibacteriota bacterium]MBK7107392.1 hypothetical protein [Ignavibacteriota bacterium]